MQLFVQVFVVGIPASPAGAANCMAPEYEPAVIDVKFVEMLAEKEQPPSRGVASVVTPIKVVDEIEADVAPDVLQVAEAIAGPEGADELPPQPAKETARHATAPVKPKRTVLVK
jgi:hypothetical protein